MMDVTTILHQVAWATEHIVHTGRYNNSIIDDSKKDKFIIGELEIYSRLSLDLCRYPLEVANLEKSKSYINGYMKFTQQTRNDEAAESAQHTIKKSYINEVQGIEPRFSE